MTVLNIGELETTMPWEKSFDETQALAAAMHLFWEKGYEATSMKDIVSATQASRYGLYDVFGDKQDLFIAALRHYRSAVVEANFGALLNEDASVAEIRQYFKKMLRFAKTRESHFGCLMCHTAVGIAAHDEKIGQYIREYFKWMTGVFESALRNAQQQGELSAEESSTEVAKFLTGLVQGAAVFGRANVELKTIAAYVKQGLSVLD